MIRWLVSNVPSWLLLVGLVILVAGVSVLILVFVRRSFPQLRGEQHNDAMRFAFGVIGMVYAFFIGFLVHAMWGQLDDAQARARAEGADGVQLVRYLADFEQVDRDRIQQRLLEYERAAIAEWPRAANDQALPEAEEALGRLYTAYSQVKPQNETQKTLLASSFDSLNSIAQARAERLIQAGTEVGPPWSLWVVIILTSSLVLGGSIIYGVEAPARHCALVSAVAVLVATNLFLIMEFAHPFIGDVAASAKPLQAVVEVLAPTPR